MTYLLDSTVLIDVLNDRNGRPSFSPNFPSRIFSWLVAP